MIKCEREKFTLYCEDCIKVMGMMDDNSIDAVVTDPPGGIAFMGKEWDSSKGGVNEWIEWMTSVMDEVWRVLKPGGHMFVWALPRTSCWTGAALYNAGFEIRDVVTHLHGQGFPKSLDISRAIDKAAGVEREAIGYSSGPNCKNYDGDRYRKIRHTKFGNVQDQPDKTAPTTPEAEQWQGWGTALKPAAEFWFLCRKPLSEKTIAENVLKWGTGGINIDGCRIESNRKDTRHGGGIKENHSSFYLPDKKHDLPSGRFPANAIFDPEAAEMLDRQSGELTAEMLDRQSGELTSGIAIQRNRDGKIHNKIYGAYKKPPCEDLGYEDTGGASRFFYCAKVSRRERGEFNKHPTVKPIKLMRYLCRLIMPPIVETHGKDLLPGVVLDPFMGSGSTGIAAMQEGFGFIGIEKDEDSFEIAMRRMEEKDG